MAFVGKLGALGSRQASTAAFTAPPRSRLLRLLGGAAAGGIGLVLALERSLAASGNELKPPSLPWSHNGMFGQLDAASVRRGWQVYKQVCAACHGLKTVRYFHLINVCLTEEEAKAEAQEVLIEDGPDKEGKMFKRPGLLSDFVPDPYPNKEAAAMANNGAIPPELSIIVNARDGGLAYGGEDYVFWLLMGYPEEGAPAGVKLAEGQAYNPYFPGGVIGMPRQLYNEGVVYDDGTIPYASQQAKDISTFLKWTADRHHDLRKQVAFKCLLVAGVFGFLTLMMWRSTGAVKHLEKMAFRVVPGREPHVGRDHAVASVLEQQAASPAHRVAATGPVDPLANAAATRHLYKSYAPRYQWNDRTPLAAKWREWQWKYNWDGYRLGLLWDDQQCDEDDDPTVREAVSRLPAWEKDARERRMIRATVLSANNETLPKSEWTTWEEETWYLRPYLQQLDQEKWDRTLANLAGKPAWNRRHILDMQVGKGKPTPD